MSHIEVEKRYKVPAGGVDMAKLMGRGWARERFTFANILFDISDGVEGKRWQIQKANETLRARYTFGGNIALQAAARTSVADLLEDENVAWTLKCSVKRAEGKREIEDPQAIARYVLRMDDARRITRKSLRAALAKGNIVPFSVVFTQRDLFTNQWRENGGRPHAVTLDASLCHHDSKVNATPRLIVEVETQVVSDKLRDEKIIEETRRAQERNVAWARSHLFGGKEWREVSGTAAMCVLRHMDARDVREIYGRDAAGLSESKLRKLRNSFLAGEILQARIDALIGAGVINIHVWRKSLDTGVASLI